jgi:hypothetical protein
VLRYIERVQAADGQPLEPAVMRAVAELVRGCKADGYFPQLAAGQLILLAGPRTLHGIMQPVVGVAPSNENFVSADYDRKLGITPTTNTKRIALNRNNNSDPPNDRHIYTRMTNVATGTGFRNYVGTEAGSAGLTWVRATGADLWQGAAYSSASSAATGGAVVDGSSGAVGAWRTPASGASWTLLRPGSSIEFTAAVLADQLSDPYFINSSTSTLSAGTYAAISSGPGFDITLLDARIATYMDRLAAALP